jgi:coenzyme F420-0:L-glutamate ligase/coenzyme F420-1:gamma-L-glutamate ligase
MMIRKQIDVIPLHGFPIIRKGDDIPSLILSVCSKNHLEFMHGDIIVVTHSIVSISEGKLYNLKDVEVSKRASEIAERIDHSPERVEVALREAIEVLREEPILITKTKHGIITDFSGVDESNAPAGMLVALPDAPDNSAQQISNSLSKSAGFNIPVIITDTQGRPWRKGAVNLAIGVAGMSPFSYNLGKKDIYQRVLRSSIVCLADQIASSAELVMGQADEGVPVVIVRSIEFQEEDGAASQIVRPETEDLFR